MAKIERDQPGRNGSTTAQKNMTADSHALYDLMTPWLSRRNRERESIPSFGDDKTCSDLQAN